MIQMNSSEGELPHSYGHCRRPRDIANDAMGVCVLFEEHFGVLNEGEQTKLH